MSAALLFIIAPVGKGAIISQLRVWLFTFTIIMTFGERSINPGHRFTGDSSFLWKIGPEDINLL